MGNLKIIYYYNDFNRWIILFLFFCIIDDLLNFILRQITRSLEINEPEVSILLDTKILFCLQGI